MGEEGMEWGTRVCSGRMRACIVRDQDMHEQGTRAWNGG